MGFDDKISEIDEERSGRARFARKAGDETPHAGFNEGGYGFPTFSDLLLEAQKRGLLKLESDKSGGYFISSGGLSGRYSSPRDMALDDLPSGGMCFRASKDQGLKAETRD